MHALRVAGQARHPLGSWCLGRTLFLFYASFTRFLPNQFYCIPNKSVNASDFFMSSNLVLIWRAINRQAQIFNYYNRILTFDQFQ